MLDRSSPPVFPADARIAIVGNAPEIGDRADAIDSAACVVRFNNAPEFRGRAGSRVTHLALINRGGQAREWAEDPGFVDRAVVRDAQTYLLPFPALPPEKDDPTEPICWTTPLRTRLSSRPIHILPETVHAEAQRLLAPDPGCRVSPSTGFLVTLAVLADRPATAAPVDVYGFGFTGWAGHPWSAERAWFEAGQRNGRLRLHPLTAP